MGFGVFTRLPKKRNEESIYAPFRALGYGIPVCVCRSIAARKAGPFFRLLFSLHVAIYSYIETKRLRLTVIRRRTVYSIS